MTKSALCIGINDYPGTQSDLRGCVNDANDWRQMLEARGFQVRQLIDGQATRERIVESIQRLVADAREGDVAVLTYSGHGTWIPDVNGDEPDHRDDCLCPHDVAQNRPLADDELFELFAASAPGARIVFIADACHAGSAARFAPAPRVLGDVAPRVRFLPPETFLPTEQRAIAARMARPNPGTQRRHGALLLTGCLDIEYSYDAAFGGRSNGAFTHVALKVIGTLRPGATYRDWFQAIRESLPSSAYPQTPNLLGSRTQKRWSLLS